MRNRLLKGDAALDTLLWRGPRPETTLAADANDELLPELRSTYYLKIGYLSGLVWPASAAMAVTARPLAAFLLGPGWAGAAPLVCIGAASVANGCFISLNAQLFGSLNRLDLLVRAKVWQTPFRLTLLAAVLLSGDLVVIASGLLLLQFIGAVTETAVLSRLLRCPQGSSWWAARCSLAPTIGAALGAAAATVLTESPSGTLGCATVLGLVGAFVGLLSVRHPLLQELRFMRDAAAGFAKRRSIADVIPVERLPAQD